MSDERAWERLAAARVGRFGTTAPRVVPVTFAVLGRSVVHAVDHKPKATRRLARLEDLARDGRATFLVDRYDEDWGALWWVRADGTARVVEARDAEGADAIDALVAKYPQYSERRPEGPVVVLDVERIVEWSAR